MSKFANEDVAREWLRNQFWNAYIKEPLDLYCKRQSFKCQLFAKCASQAEAVSISKKIKEASLKHDGE
eukprot:5025378-Pyramimonas_sp.AAC.1